jgi:hypothetical protein
MTIIFFSMGDKCGFCVKAEKLLKQLIDSGKIHKKSHSEANGKFSGFPAFLNTENGNTHTGLPSSAESLFEKLGYRDGAGMGDPDPPVPKVTDYYVDHTKFTLDSTKVTSRILTLYKDTSTSSEATNSVGFIIEVLKPTSYTGGTSTPSPIYVYADDKGPTTTSDTTTYVKIAANDKVIFLKDIKMLQNFFPCVPKSIWDGNQSSIYDYLTKNSNLFKPPAPCKSNSKVYCCPNTDVDACPEQPFFDAKTIIMISLIALLVIIIISYMMKMYKK